MDYQIIGTIAETELRNRIGVKGKIQSGLQCDVRIVIKKEKIIQLLIEKLGLYFN